MKLARVSLPLGLSVCLAVLGLFLFNWSFHGLNLRYDGTEEKLHTLSTGTQKIAEHLKIPVRLTFYFSQSAPNVPLSYKNFGQRVAELLDEYHRLNPQDLKVEVVDPKPDSDEEEAAGKAGIQGANLPNGERFYLGIVGKTDKKELSLPLLEPSRESFLEYDLSQLLVQLQGRQLKKLGLLSSLPILGSRPSLREQMQGRPGSPPWAVAEQLRKLYQVEKINPDQPIPNDLDLLLIIHPKYLPDPEVYRIDQFVLQGKPVMILVDPHSRVDPTTQQRSRQGNGSLAGSDLPKLFAHWGVIYDPKQVMGDLKRAVRVNTPQGSQDFALWQHLGKDAFNKNLAATQGLENLLLVEPGSFSLSAKSPLQLTPLLNSSDQAGSVPVDLLAYSGPESINRSIKPDGKKQVIAGLLTGSLTSAFEHRPDSIKVDGVPEGFISKSTSPVKIIILADVDFLADRFSVNQFNLLGQVISQPKNDNLGLFVNLVDFLGGSTDLMGIRSRGTFSRPFTRFEAMGAKAATLYRVEQTKLNQKLKRVQAKLSKLNLDKTQGRTGLTDSQKHQIDLFQADEQETKKALRNIRKLLNQDIEQAQFWIVLINLLLVPLLVSGVGWLVYRRRFHKVRKTQI